MTHQHEDQPFAPPEPISAELALRLFNGECEFNAALAKFQQELQPVPELSMTTMVQAFKPASKLGFCYLVRQDEDRMEVCLRHSGGAEEVSAVDSATLCSPALLLAGLLGIPVDPSVQVSKPEQHIEEAKPVQSGLYARTASTTEEPAAEALEPELAKPVEQELELAEEEPDVMGPDSPPEIASDHPSLALLTPVEIATAIKMVQVMSVQQRKSFTIAFRNAFNVPRTVVKIIGEITQQRHLDFIDRFTCESAGIAAP